MTSFQRLQVTQQDDVVVVEFVDRKILDAASIQQLGGELFSVVDSRPEIRLVLDFSKVEFMSSAALGKLVLLEKEVRKKGGKIRLCQIRPEIYEVFQITNLHRVFGIHSTQQEAIASLG